MACREVSAWITENIRQPVSQFFERAEEACHEAREWVEREVREPVERQRSRAEERCRRRSCKWWCLCCNKWFCWIEIVIYTVIEFIIRVVGEWVVETVCELVVSIVEVIVFVIVAVARFVVVGVVCLFTEPLGALEALGDLWFDIVDIIEDIGDIVTDLLDAVSDLLDIVRDFVLEVGNWFGPLGRWLSGIIAGLIDIVRRVVEGITQIVEGIFDIVTGILRLDFCAVLEGLAIGVGIGLGRVILGVVNVLSLGQGGARSAFEKEMLREWLENQLQERFDGDELETLQQRLSVFSTSFGTAWPVVPLICAISSRGDTPNLRQLHEDGVIDLYAIAGYAPFGCTDGPVSRSVYRLVYPNSSLRVTLGDIRAFLNGADDVPEFHLIAGDKDTFKDMLVVAKRKFATMAIKLRWKTVDTFVINAESERVIANATPLIQRITDNRGLRDICDLPAVLVFGYNPSRFGLASVYWRGGTRTVTGATVRSSFMTRVFGTLLAHEMGHCFSLCHTGHDGVEHIMYTSAQNGNNCGVVEPGAPPLTGSLQPVTGMTVIEYIFLGGEPRFTLQDGRDAWDWILDEARECIR